MSEATKGVIALLIACTVWGLSALYYDLIKSVPPLEVLSYRSLWSLVFFSAILLVQRRLSQVRAAIKDRRQLPLILFAAVMISANWFGFIFSIQNGRAIESSLGYYIFPLFAVVVGMIFFKERLTLAQGCAVALAIIAVIVLTIGLGVAPWIALLLATSFASYGAAKKQLPLGPVVSVTAEVALLAPLAFGFLIWQGQTDLSWQTHALLALSGPLTATPLVLFSYAARRVRLSTVGLGQYINPTLQFTVAVAVFGEAFTVWHGIAFPLIWSALLIYSVSSIRQEKASRKAASRAGTSGTVVT